MPDLFAYHDYRDYLKQVFEERKKQQSFFSYRMWARQLGMDAAQWYRIVVKELHLPIRYLDVLCENLRLRKTEAEYFRVLVQLGRAKSEKERHALVTRLLEMRDVRCKTVTREQYLFFAQWYHATLRCLVGMLSGHQDPGVLARMVIPPLDAERVSESLNLMVKLGLLQKDRRGYLLNDLHLSTDAAEVHKAIRDYQAAMHYRAAEALEMVPKEERDISTLTFAADQSALEEIREILAECRKQIQRRVEEVSFPDRVLHLNMSLFPTAKVTPKGN